MLKSDMLCRAASRILRSDQMCISTVYRSRDAFCQFDNFDSAELSQVIKTRTRESPLHRSTRRDNRDFVLPARFVSLLHRAIRIYSDEYDLTNVTPKVSPHIGS